MKNPYLWSSDQMMKLVRELRKEKARGRADILGLPYLEIRVASTPRSDIGKKLPHDTKSDWDIRYRFKLVRDSQRFGFLQLTPKLVCFTWKPTHISSKCIRIPPVGGLKEVTDYIITTIKLLE